jgi:hypothetical protein
LSRDAGGGCAVSGESGDRASDCDGEYNACVGVIMMTVRAVVFYADGNVGCGCGGGTAKKVGIDCCSTIDCASRDFSVAMALKHATV